MISTNAELQAAEVLVKVTSAIHNGERFAVNLGIVTLRLSECTSRVSNRLL